GGPGCASAFSSSTGGSVFSYPGYEQIGRVDRVVPGTIISEPELQPTGTFSADVRSNVSNFFSGQLIPGAYRVCAWLAADDTGSRTDYGPVATTVTIPGGSSSNRGDAGIPYVQGYEYRFDAPHPLRLKVWLTGTATLP